MDLESAKPKLHADVTLHEHPEGGGVARRWETGVYVSLDPDEFFVTSLFDGKNTLAELNRKLFDRCGELRITSLLHLTSQLNDAGLIETLGGALETTHTRVNPALRLLRMVTGFHLSARLPTAGKGEGKGPHPIAAVLLGLPAVGLLFEGASTISEPLKLNGSYAAGFAVVLAGLAFALTLRQVISLWVLRAFGARPWNLGLGVAFLVPHFYLDERDIAIAGRKGRITLAAFRLAVPVVLLGAADLLLAREANRAVHLLHDSWALVLLVASCPFLPVSDFRRLMAALMPAEHIWERSRSDLFERLIKQTAIFKDTIRRDPVYIVSALAYPVWCYAALVSVGALLRDNTMPLVLDLLLSGEEPALQVGIGLLVTFFAFTAALLIAIPVYGLLQAATHFVPGWHRQVSNQKRHHILSGGDTWKELGQVALFAHLEESSLKELAEKLQIEVFHAADRIFSQNDAGDHFYSIRRGQVEILRKDETGFNKSLAVLGPGQSFGEIALLEGGARTATVRAISHVECFSLHRDAFKEFIAKLGLQGAEITEFLRLSQFLRGIKLFQNLGPAETVRILQRAQRRMVTAGTRIISEGDDGNEFFLIRQGQYSVTVHGNEVARLKAGEYFGEIALLMKTKRTAKVTALNDGELLVMTRQHFYDTVASNFQLGLGLEEVTRIRRAKSQEIHANV